MNWSLNKVIAFKTDIRLTDEEVWLSMYIGLIIQKYLYQNKSMCYIFEVMHGKECVKSL